MLVYPHINPVAFHLGPLKVHWYGLMYLLSFFVGWILVKRRIKLRELPFTDDQLSDLVFYMALGVILGGRLGYMFFYDLPNFIHAPWIVFKIWQGGMSFHGGLLGVLIALLIWCRKEKRNFFDVTDLIAWVGPVGLGAGRIGNFINGYLVGRVTHVPWAMVFPYVDQLPRHPSPLYEFLLEGVLLFLILWWFSRKPRPRMATSAMFLIFYGIFRCIAECFRQPDPQLGFIAWNWLTMGQALSFPMILVGGYLLRQAYRKRSA